MRLIFFITAIACNGFSFAQEYNVTIYTTTDGLPISYIYSSYFDSHGYMWCGSPSGFCRFDGRSFTTFSTREGLEDTRAGSIYEDKEHRIWGVGFSKIYQFEYNRFHEISVISPRRINYIFWFLQMNDGKMMFSSDSGTFAFNGKKFEPYSLNGISNETDFKKIIELSDGTIIANTDKAIYEKKINGNWEILFQTAGTITSIRYHQGKIYFNSRDGIFELAGRQSPRQVFSEQGDFFFDSKNNLWIATQTKGVCFMRANGELKFFGKEYGIMDGPFGMINEDKWGNIWVGSYNGLIKLSPSFIRCVVDRGESHNTFRNLYNAEDGLFFFGGKKGTYHFKGDREIKFPLHIEKEIQKNFENKIIVSVTEAADHRLWICTGYWEVFILGEQYFKRLSMPDKIFHVAFAKGRIFFASNEQLYEWKNDRCVPISLAAEGRLTYKISGMLSDNKDQIWISDHEKLMLYRNDTVLNLSARLKIPDDVFSKLLFYNDELWASTTKMGIIRIKELNGQYSLSGTLNKANGLASDYVQSFTFHRENDLWYSTTTGIYRGKLNFQNDSVYVSFNRKFGESEGLRNTIWDSGPIVSEEQGYVWVAAVNGIYKIDAKNIPTDSFPPVIQIEKIELMRTGADWRNYTSGFSSYHYLPINPRLPYKQNSLSFLFNGITMNNASDVQFKYKLEGYDNDWSKLTLNRMATYTNLPAGNYHFMVIALNADGVWNKTPEVFTFVITPPFWQTLWFRGLGALLIVICLYYLIRRREKIKHEKNQIALQIAELRLQTLQSQMNPHFIFNSLNSVQKYILEHKPEEGARYLSKFSKLIRTILDNSHYNLLPLYQIAETLEMYIELESLRFNKEFSYELNKSQDEEIMNLKLPPMLLQPFVENAIWHGLMPKEGEKKLYVSLQKKNGMFYCMIEDNGVGRKKAPAAEGHISRGEKMIQGMADSLQQLLKVKAEIIMTDLNGPEERSGTRVEIFIPDTTI